MAIFRYRNKRLEGFVFIQIFATEPAEDTNRQDPQQRGRNGYRQQVEKFQVFTVKGKIPQHRHQRHHRYRDRAGDDPHLGTYGAGRHRTLRTNVILNGDIVDNRQDRVHHVSGTAENGQRAGDERRDD